MVLDTDENTEETAQRLTTLYTCPVEKCNRSYRTVQGLQHHIKHLKAHDHHGPGTPATPQPTSTPKNKKNKHRSKLVKVKAQTAAVHVPEPLTFEEAQKMVQLEVNGIVVRIGINDCLNVVASNSSTTIPDDDLDATETRQQTILSTPKLIPPDSTTLTQSLPAASFRRLPDYCISDAPPRANAYIRFIEKSAEELDGEVEYDVDEEDSAWLSIVNKRREAAGLAPVAVDSLELLMDRFEKESYFQATQVEDSGALGSDNSHHRPISMDDDAVCCICMDGECQNTNVILFCDMCNLAVHQDCYGVPYIPEGQWLCRRCLQSPSRAVSCVLCPNQGGAFKQTDRGDWAHVVCALWIPEVRFANTVFLEPVDSVEAVPAARWRLTCVLCRQRGVGACIQCHRASCYAAFHVTCAQHYGLYMRMQTVTHSDVSKVQVGLLTQAGVNQPVLVQKIAYCEQHSPPDYQIVKTKPSNLPHSNRKQHKSISKSGNAAKRLNNHQSGVGEVGASGAPVILLPTIPPERIQEIGALVQIQKKSQFIQRLIAYWMLKRQFRNGVPLLRRLQSSAAGGGTCGGGHRGGGGISGASGVGGSSVDTNELYQQLKYWQCLRQDLERARLLCELVRKREKLKAELIRSTERCLNVQLRPLQSSLLNIISLLSARDTNDIFGEPVDPEEVPDYTSVVTEPMDFSTMKTKCERGQYEDLTALEKDFELMISNCLKYNSKDTVFYRVGVRMREQGRSILKLAREELEKAGLLKDGLKNEFTEETKCEKDVKKKSVGVKEPSKKSKLMSHDGFVADKLPDKNRKVPEKHPSLNDDSNKSVATSSASSSTCRVTSIEDPSEVDKRLLHLQEKRAATTNLGPILKDLEVLLIQSQCLKHGLARAKRVKLVRNEIVKVKRLYKDIVEQAKKNKEAVECKKQDKHTQKKKDVKDKDKPTEILDNDNNARGQIAENLLKKEPVTKSQSEQSNANSSTTAKSSPTAPTTSGTSGDALESATSAQGVNRRTAVLFTRKALHQSAGTIATASSKKSKGKSIDEKMGKEETAPKEKGVKDDEDLVMKKALQQQPRGAKRGASRSDSTRSTASSIETPTKKPRRTTNTNVNMTAECAAVGTSTVSVQSTRVATGCSTVSADAAHAIAALGVPAGSKVVAAAAATMPDSFRVYRDSGSRKTKGELVRGGRKCRDGGSGRRGAATRQITPEGLSTDDDDDEDFDDDLMTDDDENSDDDACSSDCSSSVSTCYSHTLSEIEDISNTPDGTAQPTPNKSSKSSTHKRSSSATSPQSKSTHALKPLQLVWAKCRGYPWYPALIIDPDTPPGGVVHRGVPLPGPPADVVALRANVAANNAGKSLYLILFFDAKRTWQWLPADKLEVMDLNGDEAKTNEPRKPADRKAVKRAYEHAFRYMKQVTAGKNKGRADDEGPSPSPAAAASGIAANLTVDVNKHTQADGKASSKSSAPAT